MRGKKLSPRLASIAAMIPRGAKVVDIGTDHGYLPIYLAVNELASNIICSDINEGPLGSARMNAEEAGVCDQIKFVLADGLSGVDPSEADTVVIAGMGGELIAKIIGDSRWINSNKTFIVQPQSKIETLLDFLYNNFFAIEDAVLVSDARKLYMVVSARKTETVIRREAYEDYLPKVLIDKRDPLLIEYIELQISKSKYAIECLAKSENSEASPELRCRYETFIKLREAISNA